MSMAEAAVEKGAPYVMCRSQKTIRTIRVEKVDNGECRTVYTKAGVDRPVGNAKNPESCVSFLNNIRKNLEGASWNCRDISASKITRTEP